MDSRRPSSGGALGGRHLVGVVTKRGSLADLVTTALDPGSFSLTRAAEIGEILSDLRAGRPESLLVDLAPGVDRVGRLVAQIRLELEGDPATPVIGVGTEAVPPEARIALLRSGLWDCLTLPAQEVELGLKLDSLTAARRAVDSFRATSMLDLTTSLYNVRGLIRRLQESFAAADRAQDPVACVVLGLETVEDGGGGKHPAAVTSNLALVLSEVCRASDVVGRLGESEFAIIPTGTAPQNVPWMIRRILAELDHRISHVADRAGTVLAGYAVVRDVHEAGVRPIDILTRARIALDDLRTAGGDRMRAYDNGSARGPAGDRRTLRSL